MPSRIWSGMAVLHEENGANVDNYRAMPAKPEKGGHGLQYLMTILPCNLCQFECCSEHDFCIKYHVGFAPAWPNTADVHSVPSCIMNKSQ